MASSTSKDIAMPTLKESVPKRHDFADAPANVQSSPNLDHEHERDDLVDPTHHPTELDPSHDSSDDTATDSADEFDWDAEDDAMSTRQQGESIHDEEKIKARRLKVVWNLFMKLSRTVRTLIVGALGAGLFIAPLIVVDIKFHSSPAWAHVRAWSMWLTITWAAGIGTYLFIDFVPHFVLAILKLFGYKVERLKTPIEVSVPPLLVSEDTCQCSLLQFSVGSSCIRLAQTRHGHYMDVDCTFGYSRCVQTPR